MNPAVKVKEQVFDSRIASKVTKTNKHKFFYFFPLDTIEFLIKLSIVGD